MNLHTTIVGNADDSLFYVILSVSEISHDRSEEVYAGQFFGGILHFCYAAHNADAFKTIVLHFYKMPAPYEYRRSQTLASKFARSALTE